MAEYNKIYRKKRTMRDVVPQGDITQILKLDEEAEEKRMKKTKGIKRGMRDTLKFIKSV